MLVMEGCWCRSVCRHSYMYLKLRSLEESATVNLPGCLYRKSEQRRDFDALQNTALHQKSETPSIG